MGHRTHVSQQHPASAPSPYHSPGFLAASLMAGPQSKGGRTPAPAPAPALPFPLPPPSSYSSSSSPACRRSARMSARHRPTSRTVDRTMLSRGRWAYGFSRSAATTARPR